MALLYEAVVRRSRSGRETASAEVLPQLARAVEQEHPQLFRREDFQPYDGRDGVLTRWGPDLFRLLPGELERPTATVSQHELLASVIDPVVLPALGFGLADAVELLLRRLDQVAETLAPIWPDGPPAEVGDPPTVTEAELLAFSTLEPIASLVEQCRRPDAAQRALDRYTSAARDLCADVYNPLAASTFGATLGTLVGGTSTVSPPAGLLLEVLPALGVDLVEAAMAIDPGTDLRWFYAVANSAGLRLTGFGYDLDGPVKVGPDQLIHSLVWFDDRRVLAIALGASLTLEGRQERLAAGARRLDQARPGATFRSPRREGTIPADAQVLHVQVTAGPMYPAPPGPRFPTMGLDDLEWFLHSQPPERDDLWYFIRDLTSTRGVGRQVANDLIDKWEVWRADKSFYRGAADLDVMAFEPHAARAEWDSEAEGAVAERALHLLGMPPLRAWPGFERRGSGVDVADMARREVIHLLPLDVPAAVDRIDPGSPRQHSETLWRLSVGLDWKITAAADAFVTAARASGIAAQRIRFAFEDRDAGPALTSAGLNPDGELVIGWDSRLQRLLATNSVEVEENLGLVVASTFDADVREPFVRAWNAAPPGIRVDGYSVRQRAQMLPEPLQAHEALGMDLLRDLAIALRDDGVEPGTYAGRAGTALESEKTFPWLISRLHETIRPFSADSLLYFAMCELERLSHQRFILDKRIAWQRGFPVLGDDGTSAQREGMPKKTRVLTLLIEEVLARPPAGDLEMDATRWPEVLVVGELCIESCFRSEAIFRRLYDSRIEVSDLYEISTDTQPGPTDVDTTAYSVARDEATTPTAIPIQTDQWSDGTEEADAAEPRPMVEVMPQLADIDAAMRSSLGFGIDAITGVANVATQWEASTEAPVTKASCEVLIDTCVELAVGATREEFHAALEWLTLRHDQLQAETIPHWETERRARRVSVCPFIEAGDGSVWVLPWTAHSFLRIFANYLGDGRLPWPSTALPRGVDKALRAHRQARNRQLEVDIETALATRDLVVRGSVKPEKRARYGLAELSGEIDTLCIDAARSRIWVIEAKDPYIPFSARQIRRLIDDFYEPGKYVDKLLAKVEEVRASASSVARALGVEEPDREWAIIPLAITRRVDPAAFAVEARIPFGTVGGVADIVDSDAPPENGPCGPYGSDPAVEIV